jgi:cytochrome c oxidase subunit II
LINIQKHFRSSAQGRSAPKSNARVRLKIALRSIGTTLLVICMCASAENPARPRRVEVTAKRFAFEPAEVTLKKGEAVDFVLTSSDVAHGIRIRELNLDLRAGKGKSADVTFTPMTTGTFIGHCSVFCGSGHGQMTLTIHVVT